MEPAGLTAPVEWSVSAIDARTGDVLVEESADRELPCASLGKILVLIEAARRIHAGSLDPDQLLGRAPEDAVGDSGLWQDLRASLLPAADLCVLVGAVSDNLATNVLLRTLGLDAVSATARAIGLEGVTLHDQVRDKRGPGHPAHLATASARGLTCLFARLHRGEIVSPAVSETVLGWLAANTDLSMVASAWGLDPLAHRPADRPHLALVNKTGSDRGVRAETGLVTVHDRWAHDRLAHDPVAHDPVMHAPLVHDPVVHAPVMHAPVVHDPVVHDRVVHDRTIAYAVLASWEVDPHGAPAASEPSRTVLEVLARMAAIGNRLTV